MLYCASRIPVREALRELESEGLVVLVPNSGAWVARFDVAECDETYKIRERLEPLALGESIARMNAETVECLAEMGRRLEATTEVEEFLRLDREFHLLSYGAAGMPALAAMIDKFWNKTQHYRRSYANLIGPTGQWIIHSEHRLIIEAIRRRDVRDARHLLESHIRRTRRDLIAHLAPTQAGPRRSDVASDRDQRRSAGSSGPLSSDYRSVEDRPPTEVMCMKIELRKAEDRGLSRLGWLESHHTFSFADYFDPAYMGYGPLRVINDDRIEPGTGFPTHPHADMEIVSYILDGSLAHRDSMGNSSVIEVGDVQRMSAGTGITHSEFNASMTAPVHFLQIWILPYRKSLTPDYEQKHFTDAEKRGRFRLVGSPDGRDGSVTIHSGLDMYACRVEAGETVDHELPVGARVWLHIATGAVRMNDLPFEAGDGAGVHDTRMLRFHGVAPSEVLLFVMAEVAPQIRTVA